MSLCHVYRSQVRDQVYLTSTEWGNVGDGLFNLEGGLFGAFGLLDKESRVPFPRSWGRVTRIGLLLMIYENKLLEALANRSEEERFIHELESIKKNSIECVT